MADTFTLKGDINALDPAATFTGTVTVTPSKRFTLGNSEYPIVPTRVTVASDGQYLIPGLVLPDSPNVSPQNFTYRLNYAVTVTPAVGDPRVEAWQRDVIVTSDLVEAGVIEVRKLPTALVPGSPSPFLSRAQVIDLIDEFGVGADTDKFVLKDDLEEVPDLVFQSDLSGYVLAQAYDLSTLIATGPITYTNGVPSAFAVKWADGATGQFSAVTSALGVMSYTVTHALAGATQTYTQATMTRDGNGNITSRPAIVVTNGAPQIIPVAPTMTLSSKTDTTVVLTATGGENVASLVVKRGTTTVGTAFPLTDSGLTPNTPYVYTLTATSSDGNTATSTFGVTTNATPVIPTADTLTATAGAAGSGQITVTGSGAANFASKALYRSATSPVDLTGTPVATSLPFTDTGRGTSTWYYQEVVTSSTGNTASSNTVNATVAGAADTTPPTAPTAVNATAGTNSAILTPTGATDAVGVTGYRAYSAASGGTPVASGASPLTVPALTAGQAYTFYVSALDAAGNESSRTASNSVTPTAAGTYPAAGTVFLKDTFTAADGTVIEGRNLTEGTDGSKSWAHATDSRFLVNSNRARAATGPTGNAAFPVVDTGFTRYKMTATFGFLLNSTTMRKTGIVSAFIDSSNYLRLDGNGANWILRKIVGGSATTLLTGPAPATGDVVEYTQAADGSLSFSVNGTAVSGTATMPSELAAATKAGLFGQGTSGSSGGTVQDQQSAISDITWTAV